MIIKKGDLVRKGKSSTRYMVEGFVQAGGREFVQIRTGREHAKPRFYPKDYLEIISPKKRKK